MQFGLRATHLSLVLLIVVLTACCTETGAHQASTGDATLSQLVVPTKNPSGTARPTGHDYYAALFATFSGNTPVAGDTRCIDDSWLSFIRNLVNDHTDANSSVVATLQDDAMSFPAISENFYSSQVSETPKDGAPNCQTNLVPNGAQLTTYLSSETEKGLTINLNFSLTKTSNSKAMQTVADDTIAILGVIGGGASGFAIASTGAKAQLTQLATQVDTAWNNLNSVSAVTKAPQRFSFDTSAGVTDDAWLISVRGAHDSSSGGKLTTWNPVLTIYVAYKDSILTTPGGWPSASAVLDKPLVPTVLDKDDSIIKAIKANEAPGLSDNALRTATTADAMAAQCNAINSWLDSFMVSTDVLVTRYAIVKVYGNYDAKPAVASDSCFTSDELSELKGLSASYTFKESVAKAGDRAPSIASVMDQVNAHLDEDENAVGTADSVYAANFRFSDGKGSFSFGPAGVQNFENVASQVQCYQANANNGGTSVIAGVVRNGGVGSPAVFFFDGNGKLEQVEINTLDNVRNTLGLTPAQWPTPGKRSCQL